MSETTDLLKALKDAGLSQMDISRRTGIPQPRVSRWLKGEAPGVADDALKLKALVESLVKKKGSDGKGLRMADVSVG